MSTLAVVLLLQQVSLGELVAVLRGAEALPMAGVSLTVLVALLARTARWGLYFLPQRKVPFTPLLGTLSISYMASTFLPFRAGELVRALLLGRRTGLSFARIMGTIVLEKLFDFLAIGVMLAWLLATTPLPAEALVAGSTISAVILGGFGFVIALAIWRAPTLSLVRYVERVLPFGFGPRLKLASVATQFAAGTDSLREARLWPGLLGWTALAWGSSLLTAWSGSLALQVNPGLAAIVFLVVLTSTGQAVPSSPGYVGVYHAAAFFALTSFGVEPTAALAIAVLGHALSYATLVVAGLIALWAGGYAAGDILSTVRGSKPLVQTLGAPH